MPLRIGCADGHDRERAVAAAFAAIRRGDVVLLPMEHVYAVAVDPFSPRGQAALHAARGTDPQVPLPVMVGSRSTLSGIVRAVTDQAQALMDAFWPGLLTLLLNPQPSLAWDRSADAPVAVRMPLHPVALAVLDRCGPLAVTTANLPGADAPFDVDDALGQIGDAVSVVLDAGRLADAETLPSTIVDATTGSPRVVRLGAVSLERLRRACPDVTAGGDGPGA